MRVTLPQEITEFMSILPGAPFVVGGAVRDLVLNLKPKDFDIEVFGVTLNELMTELEAAGLQADLVGASFGVVKVRFKGHDLDVSIPRTEVKNGQGHTCFTVEMDPDLTLERALARRDFTINSMAADATGFVFDPYNGFRDLKNKVLRHTSDAFAEDPLRVLRGVQFATRFGMTFHKDTAKLCRSLVGQFDTISTERIWTEFEKMLKGPVLLPALWALDDSGWSTIFPDLCHFLLHNHRGATAVLKDQRAKTHHVLAALTSREGAYFNVKRATNSIGVPARIAQQAYVLNEALRDLTIGRLPVRTVARFLGRFQLTIQDLVLTIPHRTELLAEITRAATTDRVYTTPEAPWVTGDDLIAGGLTPGRSFKVLLGFTTHAQDNRTFESKAELLEEVLAMGRAWE